MKIILATGIFPPDIGGPATYTKNLADSLVKEGIDVKVICYSDRKENDDYSFPVVRIRRNFGWGLRHLCYFVKLFQLAQESDVIYAQGPTSSGLPSLLVAKLLNKKLALKIVGDVAWERYSQKNKNAEGMEEFQKKEFGLSVTLFRAIEKLVVQYSDTIITPSFYLKGIITGWGIKKEKIRVVYNAVKQANSADLSKEGAREKIGIKGDIILSIGRLNPGKGFATLVNILPQLLEINPDFKLVIIGSGPEKESLGRSIKELGLESKALLLGRVSHEDIPVYFKAADVFILNSKHEGLPHVVLEAMQYRTPVIASDRGGNPELVEDGVNGFLVEYNNEKEIKDAILQLWRDKDLRDKFVRRSEERVSKFTWDNLLKETKKVLSEDV